jgi:hypothetical protein
MPGCVEAEQGSHPRNRCADSGVASGGDRRLRGDGSSADQVVEVN